MATIKSYTDIEQSKKLAEILPLESADMCCFQNQNGSINCYGFPFSQANKASNPIPVWSLAALLGRLPFPVLYMEMVAGMMLWCCECHFIETDELFKIVHYDSPVDACVAMIEKLNELKML